MPIQAETNDGNPRRDFVEYDHPEGAYTLEAHVVTKNTEGEVPLVGGGVHNAREGEVLVRRGNSYDVHSADAWGEMGLDGVRDQEDLTPFDKDEEPEVLWAPEDHSAAEVRRYLLSLRSKGDDTEYDRVVEAEESGKNRASAFPKDA